MSVGYLQTRSRLASAIVGLALGACLLAAPAAAAAGPVMINTHGGADNVGPSDYALYVDPSGAAHIAYSVPDGDFGSYIQLCTIPAGGNSCGDVTSLSVGPPGEFLVQSLKFLPNPSGTSPEAYLAAGLESQTATPLFSGEEMVFGLGQTTGEDVGPVYVPLGVGSYDTGGVMLAPDGSGVDVAGITSANTTPAYEFESFQAGASGAVLPLGTEAAPICSLCLLDVMTLPQGQTAVLAAPGSSGSSTAGSAPDGMFVQPAAGGAFGPLRPLGVSGPVAGASSPGGSYVLNVETKAIKGLPGLPGYVAVAPMELYRFRGLNLAPVATIGSSFGDHGATNWQALPPIYEDTYGDVYLAWITQSADGCSPALSPSGNPTMCLIYRRVGNGGLLGPKLVLDNPAWNAPFQLSATGPIAADAKGAGWVLETLLGPDNSSGISELELEAFPLPSSATAAKPRISGTTVKDSVSCSGSSSGGCKLEGSLQSGAAKTATDLRAVPAAKGKILTYGRVVKTIRGGAKATLVLRLDTAARRLLARRHRLKLALLITETVGAVKTPSVVLSANVTFGKQGKRR